MFIFNRKKLLNMNNFTGNIEGIIQRKRNIIAYLINKLTLYLESGMVLLDQKYLFYEISLKDSLESIDDKICYYYKTLMNLQEYCSDSEFYNEIIEIYSRYQSNSHNNNSKKRKMIEDEYDCNDCENYEENYEDYKEDYRENSNDPYYRNNEGYTGFVKKWYRY